MAHRLEIKDMQIIASDYGGKCLSKEYINSGTPLAWMCKRGHTWDSPYSIVRCGCWCQQCAKKDTAAERLDELMEIAKKNGGFSLAKEYKGSEAKHDFKCKNKHTFQTTPHSLKKGFWCKVCNKNSAFEERLKKMQAVALERNGKCLSTIYKRSDLKLKWQCSKGHIWFAMPSNIEAGRWCPTCAKNTNDEKQRIYSVGMLQKYAAKLGGKLISKEYKNIQYPLKWQCKEKHIWDSSWSNVFTKELWCPTCRIKERELSNLQKYQQLAQENNGKLLSKKFIDIKTELKWQCENGHTWLARPINIKDGYWCLECAKENAKNELFIDTLKFVQEKGGKLLSDKYINADAPLLWQCKNGHTWKRPLAGIRAGSWCRKCFNLTQRSSILEYQVIAKKKGGKLLSKEYFNGTTKLEWQCDKGHKWMALPAHIKAGRWCPTCGLKIAANNRRKYNISDLKKYAKKMGGKVLSNEYTSTLAPVKWQCKKGHVWSAHITSVIYNGMWCKLCV